MADEGDYTADRAWPTCPMFVAMREVLTEMGLAHAVSVALETDPREWTPRHDWPSTDAAVRHRFHERWTARVQEMIGLSDGAVVVRRPPPKSGRSRVKVPVPDVLASLDATTARPTEDISARIGAASVKAVEWTLRRLWRDGRIVREAVPNPRHHAGVRGGRAMLNAYRLAA